MKADELCATARRIAALVPTSDAGECFTAMADRLEAAEKVIAADRVLDEVEQVQMRHDHMVAPCRIAGCQCAVRIAWVRRHRALAAYDEMEKANG